VLSVLRKATTPLAVSHGTRDKSTTKKLLHSAISAQSLGTLIPDAIVHAGDAIEGVVDAKYKSLHPSAYAPNGPQRDDLYQMAAYLGRFQAPPGKVTWGLLAYPFDPAKPDIAPAEKNSPWNLESGKQLGFASLPHDAATAVAKLRHILGCFGS
jgi:5-methylcytosine-specific restriction enzyme subunit McrC